MDINWVLFSISKQASILALGLSFGPCWLQQANAENDKERLYDACDNRNRRKVWLNNNKKEKQKPPDAAICHCHATNYLLIVFNLCFFACYTQNLLAFNERDIRIDASACACASPSRISYSLSHSVYASAPVFESNGNSCNELCLLVLILSSLSKFTRIRCVVVVVGVFIGCFFCVHFASWRPHLFN